MYFATLQVANKSELNTSAAVRYKLYLIDADVFNSDLFSHHCNEEKHLQKIFSYYSISSVYLSSLFKLSFTFQSLQNVTVDVTGSNLFPKSFCATRWIEDSDIAERAIKI